MENGGFSSRFVKMGATKDIVTVLSSSRSSDRCKTIRSGPARLVTNAPEAIELGETFIDRENDRCSSYEMESTYRNVSIKNLPVDRFVAYVTDYGSTGCPQSGGERIFSLAGEVPTLDFGTAYQRWAISMDEEAYRFLTALTRGRGNKVNRTLAFAAGKAHSHAPHDQRRKAWTSVLRRAFGMRGNMERITRSVRTATCKTALRLGWKPSVPMPKHWYGLPSGVVEIQLT